MGVGSSGAGVIGGYELPFGSWEPNSGLQVQSGLSHCLILGHSQAPATNRLLSPARPAAAEQACPADPTRAATASISPLIPLPLAQLAQDPLSPGR